MMKKILLCLLMCALVSACQQSPRKNFYLLSAPAIVSESTENIDTLIGIGPIKLAEYLHRLQIIHQTEGGRLQVADNDYWAEPLDKGITRALTLNLTQRDHTRSFVSFPWRSDSTPTHSFRVDVHSLNRHGNNAHINATWELMDNSAKTSLLRRHFIRSLPAGSGSAALAKAYSDLITELATEMDDALVQAITPD
jgi:uncharacterized lipoprotein YmbA